VWLLKEVKKAISGIDIKSDPHIPFHRPLSEIYHLKQGEAESNDRFLGMFKSTVNTVEIAQGKSIFCIKPMMIATDKNAPTKEEILAEEQKSKAIMLLESADKKRYGFLTARLEESASLGRNQYPTSVSSMYEVMMKQKQHRSGRSGVSFTQQSSNVINTEWILLDTC